MSIKIKGLDKLIKDLRKFGSDATKVVKRELSNSGTNIERAAINRAPAFLSSSGKAVLNIKQRIDKTIDNGGLTVKVGVQGSQDLDAYIEFGTGLNFLEIVNARPQDYTNEIKELARIFYKNGQGTLKGTPYLFPSYFEEAPKLIEQLKSELDKLAKGV
jgi:HK97 gp10 family phage protein